MRSLEPTSWVRTIWTSLSLASLVHCVAGCWGSKAAPADVSTPDECGVGAMVETTEVTVDVGERLQTLEGFGAAVAWYGGWYVAHPSREALRDVLFRDLGLDILRLRNGYRAPGTSPDPDGISIFQDAARSLGHEPRVLLSSWSPPAALKANGKTDCSGQDPLCTLSRDASGNFMYDAFASYWADAILAYRELGLDPYYISIQNEPDFTPGSASWEACRFDAMETENRPGYDRAFEAVTSALSNRGIVARLLGPETAQITSNRVEDYVSRLDPTQLYGVAHHLYDGEKWRSPESYAPAMQAIATRFPDLPKFQTEFSPTQSGVGVNDAAFEVAGLIHQSLAAEQASAYLHWDLFWDEKSGLVSLENPWTPSSWTTDEGYIIRPNYYGMRHFSRYTVPGDLRVETTVKGEHVSVDAFLSTDERRLTLVLLNHECKVARVTADVPEFTLARAFAFQSVGEEFWRDRTVPEKLPFTVDLQPRSINTIVLTQEDGETP